MTTFRHKEQMILQQLLRTIRKEAGLSQQELAQMLDKPQSFISKYESGERRLDFMEVREICLTLNVPLCDFIERLEEHLTKVE